MMQADPPPLFDCLEVLDDREPHPGVFNMALDEWLLHRLIDTPLLRLYRWEKPAVSFGYFEGWKSVAARYPAHELVRRWTGGGVVEHGADITYSLCVPRSHPLTNLPAGESYRLIHGGLRRVLHEVGWTQTLLSEDDGSFDGFDSRECFAKPVRHDLLRNGRKISGAAQRRTRAGLLHQGSVQTSDEVPLDPDAFARTLPIALAARTSPATFEPCDRAAASELSAAKYATSQWLQRV